MLKKSIAVAAAFAALFSVAACKKQADSAAQNAPAASSGKEVAWMDYTEGMKKAKEAGKPVMVDFYTTWCKYCRLLDETTYKDPGVVEMLNRDFVAIKVNAEGSGSLVSEGKTMTERELAEKLNVKGFPTIWFYDQQGKPVGPVPGYAPPEEFKPYLTFITSGAYARGMEFGAYLKSIGRQ